MVELRTAFSNGAEWDAWSWGWCHVCSRYDDCSIVLRVLAENVVPPEWDQGEVGALGVERYSCREYVADSERDA